MNLLDARQFLDAIRRRFDAPEDDLVFRLDAETGRKALARLRQYAADAEKLKADAEELAAKFEARWPTAASPEAAPTGEAQTVAVDPVAVARTAREMTGKRAAGK